MNAPSHLVAVSPEPAESLTDRELLSAWIEVQDTESLGVLVRRYATLVMGVCRRQCRRRQDVDDAFQATFLCLMRSAHKIRSAERLPAWLHGTAFRTSVSARRRSRDITVTIVDDPPIENDPLMQIARRHELRILDEELAQLAEPFRAAIVLHWIEGFTTADVADRLGVTTAVIRGRLQRGRRQLERRLRLRGVASVAVVASLMAWPVDSAVASAGANAFIATQLTTSSAVPPTDVTSTSLESLLETGTSTMTWTTTILCTTVLAIAAMAYATPWGESANTGTTITAAVASNELASPPVHLDATDNVLAQKRSPEKTQPAAQNADAAASESPRNDKNRGGDMMMREGMGMSGMSASAVPHSLRKQIEQQMTEPASFNLKNVSIDNLAHELRAATGLPVVTDRRGVAMTTDAGSLPDVTFNADSLPLQVALRELLRPAALRAEVRDDSLVITADTAELARRGIDANRWVNVDQEAAKKIQSALSTEVSFQFVEEPLDSALEAIGQGIDLPIDLNAQALEEYGLTVDTPITLSMDKVQARTLLEEILRPMDLTTSIQRERLQVTSTDWADSNLNLRIYWLDGLGLPVGDYDSIMQSIQSSVKPDTWEALGGSSTMTPLGFSQEQRPGLLISTTLPVHLQIESLIQILRETHLGPDTGTAYPHQTTRDPNHNVNQGGGMGGEMGGFGGGGGMF